MTFDYLRRVVVDGQLDVDDMGNCAILGRNDFGEEFYLFTKTELGWVELIEYGPRTPDIQLLPTAITLTYSRFEWNEGKLERLIDKWLNDGKRMISQAELTTHKKIKDLILNPVDIVLADIDDEDEFEELLSDEE